MSDHAVAMRLPAAKLLRDLPAMPVVAVRVVRDRYGTTDAPTRDAVEALESAGILRGRSVGKRTRDYFADGILDLVGIAERRPASTRFDTRLSPPSGFAVPE